ncbi:Ceroid-lipofuscinosis neuronal 5 [Pelomyxa schiedti]|nr:Ceroid-lipofuscinosis neuronal 5 [Pelomyxa schiedti]
MARARQTKWNEFVVCLAAVLSATAFEIVGCEGTIPGCSWTDPPCGDEPATIPLFDSDDSISIYWLEAPLMEYIFGNLLGALGMKHAAIGIHSDKLGRNYTIEYVGEYGFFNTSIPHLMTEPDGSQDLLWCDSGALCTENDIDQWYFNHTQWPSANIWLIGKIGGAAFNKINDLIYSYQAPYYNLWLVMDRKTSEIYLDSYTCQTFALWLLDQLYAEGATFYCGQELDSTDAVVYSGQPQLADYNDPTTHAEIIDFYTFWQLSWNMTLSELLEDIDGIATDPFKFVYAPQQYYYLAPEVPYIGVHTSYHPQPGCNN